MMSFGMLIQFVRKLLSLLKNYSLSINQVLKHRYHGLTITRLWKQFLYLDHGDMFFKMLVMLV